MRKILLPMIAAALALALFGVSPCEPPKLADSIDPVGTYLDEFITNGATKVPAWQTVAYLVGKPIDPASIDSTNVVLQPQGGGPIQGIIGSFDLVSCAADPVNGCPRGIYFNQGPYGGCALCDLDPHTTYELIINVTLASGDPFSKTITFTTGDFPKGHTPFLCSAMTYMNYIITDNAIDDTAGLGGDLTTETTQPLEISAYGVEQICPFLGQTWLKNPTRYDAMLEILNQTGSDYVLLPGDTLKLKVNGNDLTVVLPGIAIPNNETLALYISEDGSTYYALYDSVLAPDHTYDISGGDCDDADWGCPSLTPPEAFTAPNLARAADGSPSLTPLKIFDDSLDPRDGNPVIFGGKVADAVANSKNVYFKIFLVESKSPYYGWDMLNSFFTILAYRHYSDGMNYFFKSVDNLVGRYDHTKWGTTFQKNWGAYIRTPNSFLLVNVLNRGTIDYVLTSRTLDFNDDGSVMTIRLPDLTIPAGESLPLYVADDGATFWAYDAGNHTLDLRAAGCVGKDDCPILNPAEALKVAPAKP